MGRSAKRWPEGVVANVRRRRLPLEQRREDYRMALLIPASRLATVALTDLGVSELLEQHYG